MNTIGDAHVWTDEGSVLLLQVKLGRARVGVFLCGPPPVKRELRDLCTSLNKEGSTVFCFHAEKFF